MVYNTMQYCISVISTVQSFLATLGCIISYSLWICFIKNKSSVHPLVVAFSAISLVICSYLILNEAISYNKLLGIITILLALL